MTIDENTISECHRMAETIAPELGEFPLYILGADALGDLVPRSCLGWACGQVDGNVRKCLGEKYVGPGNLIVLDGKAIAEAALPGSFHKCALNVFIHELAHVVPVFKPAAEVSATPEDLKWDRKLLAYQLTKSSRSIGLDSAHDWRFVRRAIHCWVRAAAAGFEIPIGGLLSWCTHAEKYLPILVGEAIRFQSATFATIESTVPPEALLWQFEDDITYSKKLFN